VKTLLPRWLALFAAGVAAAAPAIVTDEISIGFLPADWVAATLKKTLSPQGRSVWVSPTGPVRISDQNEKLEAARTALGELQKAPALVPIELTFATMAQRTVQRLPVEPPVVSDGIRIPQRYDPPRIIANGNGSVVVIPAQPREFRTRNVGPGTVVNPSPTGYQTLTPEVRMAETVTTGGISRRFSASTVPGKPVLLTVLRQVSDPAALRALALRFGAIADTEPAWTAATTELLVTPQISGAALVVNVVPQIVLPPLAPGQAPRRIPISSTAAGVMVARGAPSNTGMLPKTDPEFYRVFFGAAQAEDDTFTALTVAAQVQYLGGPPQ
jgi:hypothetical protein